MLRGSWRLLRALVHALHGVLVVLLRFPTLPREQRRARIAWWSAKMLRVLGLRLQVRGQFKPGVKFIVANHVSWLDIMAIHAVCPEARFVAKADLRRWPVANRLIDAAETLYIQRESRRDALRVVHQVGDALAAGDTVAVFPEGTTGPGDTLLPFHANLLQAAIATGTPVQPVVLRFADRQARFSVAAQYIGTTTLAQSLWRLACGQDLVVHVTVLAPQGSEHADRRALSEHLRSLMAAALAE